MQRKGCAQCRAEARAMILTGRHAARSICRGGPEVSSSSFWTRRRPGDPRTIPYSAGSAPSPASTSGSSGFASTKASSSAVASPGASSTSITSANASRAPEASRAPASRKVGGGRVTAVALKTMVVGWLSKMPETDPRQ